MIAETDEEEQYGVPISDEDPNEDQVDWQEQKVILAAMSNNEVQKKGPCYSNAKDKIRSTRFWWMVAVL